MFKCYNFFMGLIIIYILAEKITLVLIALLRKAINTRVKLIPILFNWEKAEKLFIHKLQNCISNKFQLLIR
jgi:hypothetical protein